jgi:hypothetical protein
MKVRPSGFDSRLECLRSTSILVHRNFGGPQKLDYLVVEQYRFVPCPSSFHRVEWRDDLSANLNYGGRMAQYNPSEHDSINEITSKRRKGFPSETRVKRCLRIVHGDKELFEKLGRKDLCPCGSGRSF